MPESTEAAVSETIQEVITEPVDDTQAAFYVLKSDSYQAAFSNLRFEGDDMCMYDVMIANLSDEEIELDSPLYAKLASGGSILVKDLEMPILHTDKYGLSGVLFEIMGYTETDEVSGQLEMYYDRDTNEVVRTELIGGSGYSTLVYEYSNELVSAEVYYKYSEDDWADAELIVTNTSSYTLYDREGALLLEPGQSMSMWCLCEAEDEDTWFFAPQISAYNASRIPVLSEAIRVLCSRRDLTVLSSTEMESYLDLEQAKNTDAYRVNKYKRVNAEAASTPYYTLTVKEIRAEGQEDGTILVTLTGELTNNYGMFYMLGTDVWKMGGELAYASGYPGYFGTESAQKITCSYTVSDEKDLGGTATFVMEGGWDPRSMAVLFGKETHSIHVEWTDFEPSFSK